MRLKGIVFTIISALLYGATPVLASMTYEMGSTPETLTFYRNLMAVPVLLVVMLFKKRSFRISRRNFLNIAIVGVIGSGVTTLMLYISYQYVGVGTATTLHFLYPIFVALICKIFFKEHLGVQKITALVVAIGGIICFLECGQIKNGLGLLLAITSGLTYAFFMVEIDHLKIKDIDPYKVSFYMAVCIAAAMLLYDIPTQKIVFSIPMKAVLYTLVISVCTSFFAVALLQLGIKYLGATTAAIFCLVEPITSVITGWVILGEAMDLRKIIGCLLVISAVVILVVKPMIPSGKSAN